LTVYSMLFAGGMWMSKVAQPLHFENAGALVAFGIGYAVMALAGGLSFAWGALADRIGGRNAVLIGTLVYAAGIAGRLVTELGATIGFSALAGAGASLALTGIRPWVRSQVRDDQISVVVAGRNLGNQIGVFIGTVGAAALFAAAAAVGTGTDAGPAVALIAAPVLVVLAALWLLLSARKHGRDVVPTASAPRENAPQWRGLAVKLAVIGVLSGFYVSLITPYLPLFLTRAGLPDSGAALVIGVMSAAQIAVTAVLARRGTGPRPFGAFVVAEVVAGALTLGVGLLVDVAPVLLAALFIARAGFVALAVTAEETIQYAVIPGAAAGLVFGISQTAFLVGDALGGAVGAPLWGALGPAPLALIAGGVTVLNAVLLPVLLRTESHRRSGDLTRRAA